MSEPLVLYLIGQLTRGGSEQQLYNLLSLDTSPATVLAFSAGGYWANPIRELGYPVIELERHGRFNVGRLQQVVTQIRQVKPELVHLFGESISGLYGRLGVLLTGHPRFIVSERSNPATRPSWFRTGVSLLNHRVAALVCNSYASRDYLVNHHLIDAAKLSVIPNGIDCKKFQDAVAGAWPLPDLWRGKTIIGAVGRLTHDKSPETLVRLAAQVTQQQPDARFVVIGDGPLRSEMESLIKSLGVGEVICLLGERSDVPALLKTLDIFVMTSRNESMPNAVIEAMAAGLPVVVTDVGDCRQIVEEGETGFVVSVGDENALTENVIKLINDPSRRREVGAKAQQQAQAFSIERMAQSYHNLYCTLLSQGIP